MAANLLGSYLPENLTVRPLKIGRPRPKLERIVFQPSSGGCVSFGGGYIHKVKACTVNSPLTCTATQALTVGHIGVPFFLGRVDVDVGHWSPCLTTPGKSKPPRKFVCIRKTLSVQNYIYVGGGYAPNLKTIRQNRSFPQVGAKNRTTTESIYCTLYLLDILGIFKSSKHETNDNPSYESSEYDIHSNLSFQHGYFNMGHCITQPKQCTTFAGKSRKNQSSTFAINQFGSPQKDIGGIY